MKRKTPQFSKPSGFPALLAPVLLAAGLVLAAAPRTAQAQVPSANPPALMTYQGYLVDADGNPLATNAPQNYDVIFRIYPAAQGGTALWTEQQTVTVDKGYFSVLLGEGSQYNTEPHPNLAGLFAAPDASDRYVEITVKGIGSGGGDVTIQPRLRLLTSPYSFLAQQAVSATTLVNDTNRPILSASGNLLTISGNAAMNSATISGNATISGVATAASFSGNGSGLTALNAANLTAGTLPDARLSSNVALRSGDNTFSGAQIINGNVGIGMPPTNTAALQVNGDIQLGSGAADYAVSGQENLRVVRAKVGSAGTIYAGTGYSVAHNSTGNYTITFTPPFGDIAAVTVTPVASPGNYFIAEIMSNDNTANSVTIQIFGTAAHQWDAGFNFIAIGAP